MDKNIQELLAEQLAAKNISIQRLQHLTGIPERYLLGIIEGDSRNVPPLPYVRGYLLKIGEVIGLNNEELWKKYKAESEIQSSGLKDRLPENRYAIRTIEKRWFVLVLGLIAIIVYAGFNLNHILGRPTLSIYSPAEKTILTAATIYNFSGKINPRDTLKINNEEVIVSPDGEFNQFYNLQFGLNTFEISVKRLLGKETKVVRQIIYENK